MAHHVALAWGGLINPLFLSGLDQHATSLVMSGWAPRTRSGYGSAIKRYLAFASTYSLEPLPLTEPMLLRYVAHLNLAQLAPSTIKNYLSALRAWVLSLGFQEPCIWTPRVQLACRAVGKAHPPPRQPLPIGYELLSKLIRLLSPSHDHLLIASALSLQYFACLRASELCSNPALSIVPTRADISFFHSGSSLAMVYNCRTSKTSHHGFKVHVGCSGKPTCAPCIMHHFLPRFPVEPASPLFRFSSGSLLSYPVYNSIIKSLVQLAGLDPTHYSSHSVRAGAATQAAEAGLDPDSIKRLGRWRSDAYMVYLRPPPESYAAFAPALTSNSSHSARP